MPDNYIFFGPLGLFQRAAAAGCRDEVNTRALVKLLSTEIVPFFRPAGGREFDFKKMRMLSSLIPALLQVSPEKCGSVYTPAWQLKRLCGWHCSSSVKFNERGVTCA
ncbi:hypothetical protein [Leisingera sp. ANG-M7]|uniref:hypothetical protein n=1 Tax=Leisingera sp. ANG-M7 TaxID=1577902 RepID=UPI00058045B4|nr:hypothetical protein [Leisingera sp. ANG-M7]KIC36238.1 hypothetical protein RA26_13980 [Leisingera sp. ANG-M7]